MRDWVLIIVGLPGVGKSTLSAIISDFVGTGVVNSGDLLRKYLREQSVKLDDEIFTGSVFLKRFGEAVAGEVIALGAVAASARIVDGLRLYSTLEAFRRRDVDIQIALLNAPPELRRERFIQRALSEGLQHRHQAESLMRAKDEWGQDLPLFEAISRWRFENSGSIDDLKRFASRVCAELGADGYRA